MSRIYQSNFKITKKSDVYYFLDMCLFNGEEYIIKVREDFVIFIIKDNEGAWKVYANYGESADADNPDIKLSEEEAIRTLWFYRKKINDQFFKEQEGKEV